MKALLVYPEYPETFWSFKYALKFISKKASYPPLGLITIAGILPRDWEIRLIDMNVTKLTNDDILWADYVFISAMSVQEHSVKNVIKRCNQLERKVVAGGPLFTARFEEFEGVNHFVLNEGEITLPLFIEDLKRNSAKKIYRTDKWADITNTPVPLHSILEMDKYAAMNIQYSRGCPYDCEFCDITVLFGRKPRTKNPEQIIAELESLYNLGWRGGVFFVDDNFIGNKKKLKEKVLPAIIMWMEEKEYPFTFSTETSINLADDEELMRLMARAGFNSVFIGIESPHEESLEECNKDHNRNRDLVGSIKKIQSFGFEVMAGFIIGFDNDPPNIFDKLVDFVNKSNIITAMVGLLNAPVNTKLYERLKKEGRIANQMTGDNTDFSTNILPKMNMNMLIEGYQKVVKTIYSPKVYYERIKKFLLEYNPSQPKFFHYRPEYTKAFLKSLFLLGLYSKERFQYWRLFFWSLFKKPRLFPLYITFAIYGYHFRKIFEKHQLKVNHCDT